MPTAVWRLEGGGLLRPLPHRQRVRPYGGTRETRTTRGAIGFILGEDRRSRFFHAKDVKGTFDLLKEGMRVEFMSVEDETHGDKLQAKLVRPRV